MIISIAPYPPRSVRQGLSADVWTSYTNVSTTLLEKILTLSGPDFRQTLEKSTSIETFLLSYVLETSAEASGSQHVPDPLLRRQAFLVTRRILLDPKRSGNELLSTTFLAALSKTYRHSKSLPELFTLLWLIAESELAKLFGNLKSDMVKNLTTPSVETGSSSLELAAALAHATPRGAAMLIAGSDMLDAATEAYPTLNDKRQSELLVLIYLCLVALLQGQSRNHSLLFDHLYGLRAVTSTSDNTRKASLSLLQDLVAETPLLAKMQNAMNGKESARASTLIKALRDMRRPGDSQKRSRPHHTQVRRANGKKTVNGHDSHLHVHQLSLVTQIQDLFPDLGSAFVIKLLDEYDNDVEQITAHLLEDSLSAHLSGVDRSADLSSTQAAPTTGTESLLPRATPPASPKAKALPIRRNIHDDDAFDRLEISPGALHHGRASNNSTADALLADTSSHATNKAAILSALAAFDADDDERDDTYDVEDVGGTIDSARPGGAYDEADAEGETREKSEEALFRAWQSRPQAEKAGSAICHVHWDANCLGGGQLGAEKARARILRPAVQKRREVVLLPEVLDEHADVGEAALGGVVAMSPVRPGAQDTTAARHRKEANKGARANHNRRDQRARKVARAGFPG
ncbi:hypothetical protein MRB53_040861 [Persea americana]|nr:hypothetical protein MRB53_040861 [Persea americana]